MKKGGTRVRIVTGITLLALLAVSVYLGPVTRLCFFYVFIWFAAREMSDALNHMGFLTSPWMARFLALALCVLFSAVFACAESWDDDAPGGIPAGKNTGLGGAGGVWGDLGEFMTMGGYGVTTFDSGDFRYQLSEDGQYAVLVAYLGTEENVAFPEQLDGIPVAAVGNAMCVCNEVITNLVIPGSVRYIGTNAFANCRNLVYVYIPASVTSIASDAFADCPNVIIDRVGD